MASSRNAARWSGTGGPARYISWARPRRAVIGREGMPLLVDAAVACEAEELVEELLDAGPRGEGEADSRAGAAVRCPGVWGARRYGDGLPGAADGLVAATTQEDVAVDIVATAVEDLELLLL